MTRPADFKYDVLLDIADKLYFLRYIHLSLPINGNGVRTEGATAHISYLRQMQYFRNADVVFLYDHFFARFPNTIVPPLTPAMTSMLATLYANSGNNYIR